MLDIVLEVTTSHEQIAISVVVEINHPISPRHAGESTGPGRAGRRNILEQTIPEVAIQRGKLPSIGREMEIKPSIIIVVTTVDSHAGLCIPVTVIRNA